MRNLHIRSSAPDTAFVARLPLVARDNSIYLLRTGAITLSHRNGKDRPATYSPGELITVDIEMPPLLWALRSGESLHLEIGSSDLPAFVQHSNVLRDPFDEIDPQPAVQTIELDVLPAPRLELEVSQP